VSDERRSAELTITEKSLVKLSLPTAIVVVGALISMTASGVLAWASLRSDVKEHVGNVDVHLDPKFIREHGVPVGKWDLAPRDEATARALEGLQRQADYAVKKAEGVEAAWNSSRPKWHP
jgi:hypothetical protein